MGVRGIYRPNPRARAIGISKRMFRERGPCYICGSTKKIAIHHVDYRFPGMVYFLCHKHHMGAHAIIRRGYPSSETYDRDLSMDERTRMKEVVFYIS